jgi:hypothetical protein
MKIRRKLIQLGLLLALAMPEFFDGTIVCNNRPVTGLVL